jgi:hypothetical protein
MRFRILLSLIGTLSIMGAVAQEPCSTCPAADIDAPTANWLAWEGFDEAAYAVALTWEERAPFHEGLVTGYRLSPRDGGEAVDVYRDTAWQRLDQQTLAAIGIVPKQWDAPRVSTAPEIAPAFIKTTREPVPLPATALTVPPTQHGALPPLDLGAVLREDAELAASGAKQGLRYGVRRPLPAPLHLREPAAQPAAWTPNGEGGHTATMRISAPGAVGMRLLLHASLPEESRVYLFNAANPKERYGPFTPKGEWWSPSCFGESVVVVVETMDDAPNLDIRLTEVAHLYRSLDTLPFAKQAGDCNNDVACHPEWASAALGVGGLGSISQAGNIWCTGSLLADTNPATAIPYFVTANHCVGSASQANTVEVYWLFQSPACGESAPDPSTVPRTTGGAELLVTSTFNTGTDFTLLRLRELPPDGLVYLGFNSAPQALGTPVTCIHHPRGTYKRISFGDFVNTGSPSRGGAPLADPERFLEILWNDGTTEPGSSGSPLLLKDTQQFIGQLYGGSASCSLPDEPDYYGRFDVSYSLAAAWLNSNATGPDVDGNGVVDARDLQLLIRVVLGKAASARADVDGNGVVDARDLQLVVQAILRGGKAW